MDSTNKEEPIMIGSIDLKKAQKIGAKCAEEFEIWAEENQDVVERLEKEYEKLIKKDK